MPKSDGLDPNERVRPITGRDTGARLDSIIRRHGGKPPRDVDPSEIRLPMPPRGVGKDQMTLLDTEEPDDAG